MISMVEMDVVLLQRKQAIESKSAKRRFAAIAVWDGQQEQRNAREAKAGGAVRKLVDLLRSPAGTLSSAESTGQ